MTTPTELAAMIGGESQNYSQSPLAKRIRKVCRREFGTKYAPWHLNPKQVARVRSRLG